MELFPVRLGPVIMCCVLCLLLVFGLKQHLRDGNVIIKSMSTLWNF